MFDFGSDWKQVFILVRLTSQQKSTLALQQRLKDFQNQLSDTEGDNQKLNATLNRLQATLNFLSSSGETSGITPLEEKIFRNILRNKQNHSSGASCIITAKNPHGRPIYLQQIRRAEVPSNKASSRTVRARSKSSELFLELTSTRVTQSSDSQHEAKAVQTASIIKRDKGLF